MKRRTLYILSLALLAGTLASCKKDLLDANKNPNAAQNPQPDYLLTASSKLTADLIWGADNNMNSSVLIIQHWAKIQYPEPDFYLYSNTSFTSLWNTGYSQSITDLNTIIAMDSIKSNNNYKGVALTLRAWVFQILTDNYGDIPYSQSGNIAQNITPAYDKQQDVYNGLLADLSNAQSLLNASGPAINGDVIFGGKIDRWKKFVNSLRLRIALRIADRTPDKSQAVITAIATEGGSYIGDNTESAQLVYQDSPNQNPVSNLFDTRDDYRISKSVTDRLYAYNDPRLPIYANKPTDTTVKTYVGIPNGLSATDANSLGLAKTSRPGSFFSAPHAPAVILSYSESLFDRAEAAARGFTTEDAATLYKQAIGASWATYSIPLTGLDAYVAQPSVAYNTADFRKSIGEQKWIALFGQGLEAFAEWRRLDYPVLTPAAASVLAAGQIPVRFFYPGTEQTLNGANYTSAVQDQGADNLTTRLWFDVK